jgi:hypothetical protein
VVYEQNPTFDFEAMLANMIATSPLVHQAMLWTSGMIYNVHYNIFLTLPFLLILHFMYILLIMLLRASSWLCFFIVTNIITDIITDIVIDIEIVINIDIESLVIDSC